MEEYELTAPVKRPAPSLLLTTGIALCGLLASAIFLYEIYLPHSASQGAKKIIIPQGYGSRMIGSLLKKEDIIGSKWAFILYVTIRGEASSLKPGQYTFFETASIADITRDLVAGALRERALFIPEGWDNADIAAYLSAQGFAKETAIVNFFRYPPEDMLRRFSFLSELPKDAGLEGYLFPDTYRVFEDARLEQITIKMLENFDRKITTDMRAEISRQKKTIFEIITMASLIEKEVISDEDRAIVAGILWKRLSIDMPLQVDATIAYIKLSIINYQLSKNEKISIEDTKLDSPYNTYRHRGLPPGPIANPGLSAIHAAIYPKSSPYFYYLSAPDNRTIFSRILEEHNAAKIKYLK